MVVHQVDLVHVGFSKLLFTAKPDDIVQQVLGGRSCEPELLRTNKYLSKGMQKGFSGAEFHSDCITQVPKKTANY